MVMKVNLIAFLAVVGTRSHHLVAADGPHMFGLTTTHRRLLFGIRAGSSDTKNNQNNNDDYERAEKAIFRGIEQVEAKVQKAVEEEVHVMFDDPDHPHHHKVKAVAPPAKEAATKGAAAKRKARATKATKNDKNDDQNGVMDDYERAEKAIFHGIEQVEARVQKAVEEEVHVMFDDPGHPHHHQLKAAAKEAVTKGAAKVKARAKAADKNHHKQTKSLPFLPSRHNNPKDIVHHDHTILHAVEAAEKAVLQAVQEEVDSLFHAEGHEPHKKVAVEKGVQKAKEHIERDHKKRQQWMEEKDGKAIDEYIKSANSLYGMGF